MNKQNEILDLKDILNTYRHEIPKKKFEILTLRRWVPLFQDSILARQSAYFIGKIIGDGNLDKSFTCRFVGQIDDLNLLKDQIIKIYSIKKESQKIRVKKARGNSYMLQINDSLFGRFFYSLGAPVGNKTKTEFLVPEWITKSKHCKKHFLQAIFDDELSTIKIKRKKFFREATFRMVKIERYQRNLTDFLHQIKNLTESFSVQSSKIGQPHFESIQKDGSKTFSQCFRILGNKRNIVNFSKYIGFGFNESKIKELTNALTLLKK